MKLSKVPSIHEVEQVVKQIGFHRKSVLLMGARGVGRRYIKHALAHLFPDRFAFPIARIYIYSLYSI